MRKAPRTFYVVMASALAGLAVVGLMLMLVSCSNINDPVCKAIEQGIAAIDKELAKGSDDAEVLAIYQQSIEPVVRAKGLDSVLDMAKEYWDSMSTADKLKMGRAILVFMQGAYCGGGGGCVGEPKKDMVQATVTNIIRRYTADSLAVEMAALRQCYSDISRMKAWIDSHPEAMKEEAKR